MPEAAANADLVGRKQVRLKARPNLRITSRQEGGRLVHVVKDPVSLQYFHLEEPQRFALGLMDGRHSLEDIQRTFESEYKPQRLSLQELETFSSQLVQCGLVETPAGDPGKLLLDRLEKRERLKRWSSLLNVFFIKVPLVNPNDALTRLAPIGRLVFHPLFAAAAAALFLAAIGLVCTRWDAFLDRLPSYHDFFSWHNLLYLWLALGLVKVVHELGHGLCAKVVGGDVHEMGVVFLLFFPTLYCNVSDTCTIPSKWKRMAVSAAGIYVELFIAALSVFLWWSSDPNTFVHNLSFALMLVCSVHTLLFNANPLMRFDGYFVLSDWMEIPNMAQAASRRLQTAVLGWFGVPAERPPVAGRFLLAYGVASLVYRVVVLGSILWLIYLFLKEHRLPWLGLSLVLVFVLMTLVWPVVRVVQAINQRGGIPEMKSSRVWLAVGSLIAVTAVVGFAPFPMKVRGTALVQIDPAVMHRLVVPVAGGFLEHNLVRDGQRVREGDVLFVLRNPALERKLRLNELEQALRTEQRQMFVAQLAAEGARADAPTQHELDHEWTALVQQHTVLKGELAALTIRAPADGTILGLPGWDAAGKWLEPGAALCAIGDTRALRATVLVDPADRQLVAEGRVAAFVANGGGALVSGAVSGVAQVDEESIPPQLSSRSGGEVVTTQDPGTKTERPRKQHFVVTVRLDQPAPLQVGTLGRIRIDAGESTLWWRFQSWLGSTFRGGL